MGLYLRSRELNAISATADVLGAPHAFDSVRSWALDAGTRLRDLLGGEAAILYGSALAAPAMWSVDLDPTITQRFGGYVRDTGPVLRSHDAAWDASLEQRRAARTDVYTMADVRATLGDTRLEDLPIYQEVTEPSRMLHAHGIANVGDNCESHLVVMSSRDDRWRFRDDTREVVRLLLPAFRAGCGILSRAGMSLDDPRRPVGSLPDAAVVFDHDGNRLLDASPALTRIADATRGGELLLNAIRSAARTVAASVRGGKSGDATRPLTVVHRLSLQAADVEIVATWAGAALTPAADVVLVAVHCAATQLPTREELMRRWSLTSREADVALLLARGLARLPIAQVLGLSAHTIRHHTEAVFRKLEVHTRAAVAATVLRSDGPAPTYASYSATSGSPTAGSSTPL